MKKFNKQTILDYINGNDIDNVEELEDNKEFMSLVIKISNDYNFYNLCSDNLKKDYEFVKYLVIKFKNNLDFICRVSDYYLEYNNDEFSRIELNMLMYNLTINNKDKNYKYSVTCDGIYLLKRLYIEKAKLELDNDEVGMGFLVIFDSYNDSKIILDYYAKRIIDDIFKENDINLELMLHEQFKILDDIKINNFMLEFISYYDSMLSYYLSTNMELLDFFKKRIKDIQDNWDSYNLVIERKKYNLLFEKVHEYYESISDNCSFDEISILYYIGNKLGIVDKLLKYDFSMSEDLVNELDMNFIDDNLKFNMQDKFYYNAILNIVKSIILDGNRSDSSNKSSKLLKLY